jgi:predicted negative regulator of RcsB-dependent stress response
MDAKADELPLSDRFWTWYEANKKPALIGLCVIVAAAAIAGFVAWHHTERETASGEALSNAAAEQMAAGPAGQADAGIYLKIADKYPGSAAGSRALLMAAGNLFQQAKYDQAKAQFERFTREYSDSPLMGEALLGIAACLEGQGKTPEATAAYKTLAERHPNDAVVPQAKFALARLYAAQDKPELAKTLYEDVTRLDPYGSMGNEAGIRLEELKWKYPSLNPPAPPPSPPMASPLLPTNIPHLKLETPTTNK